MAHIHVLLNLFSASYLGSVSDETYNSSRKCWTSRLDGISVEEDNNDYMNNSLEIFKALKLNWENYTTEITIQSQTCFCSGWYCNGGKSCQLVTKSVLLMSLISVIHTHTYIYMNSNCDYWTCDTCKNIWITYYLFENTWIYIFIESQLTYISSTHITSLINI